MRSNLVPLCAVPTLTIRQAYVRYIQKYTQGILYIVRYKILSLEVLEWSHSKGSLDYCVQMKVQIDILTVENYGMIHKYN